MGIVDTVIINFLTIIHDDISSRKTLPDSGICILQLKITVFENSRCEGGALFLLSVP